MSKYILHDDVIFMINGSHIESVICPPDDNRYDKYDKYIGSEFKTTCETQIYVLIDDIYINNQTLCEKHKLTRDLCSSNNNIVTFCNGVRHGLYNTTKATGMYKNGKKDGLWKITGQNNESYIVTYDNGLPVNVKMGNKEWTQPTLIDENDDRRLYNVNFGEQFIEKNSFGHVIRITDPEKIKYYKNDVLAEIVYRGDTKNRIQYHANGKIEYSCIDNCKTWYYIDGSKSIELTNAHFKTYCMPLSTNNIDIKSDDVVYEKNLIRYIDIQTGYEKQYTPDGKLLLSIENDQTTINNNDDMHPIDDEMKMIITEYYVDNDQNSNNNIKRKGQISRNKSILCAISPQRDMNNKLYHNRDKNIKFYPNGNVKSETTYAKYLKHGNFKKYYENGNIKKSGTYKNGNYIGELIEYDNDDEHTVVNFQIFL